MNIKVIRIDTLGIVNINLIPELEARHPSLIGQTGRFLHIVTTLPTFYCLCVVNDVRVLLNFSEIEFIGDNATSENALLTWLDKRLGV